MRYDELIHKDAPAWPYTVAYEKETEVSSDVLVLGGGIAGCWAAIGAARKGASVVLVEKGVTRTSGCGGSGVDHWHDAVTNPACKISPEEFAQAHIENFGGYNRCGIGQYISSRESYDCLLDLEKMGVKIRDSEDEFKGAAFRDEKTKLLFSYDYTAKYCIRVWGHNIKMTLYKECRRLGVKMFDHVAVTSLLNKGGKSGAKIVGAAGINVRTGEYYIFKAKASVLAMAKATRNWIFSTEIKGLYVDGRPPGQSGDGHALAWRAGAEITGAEQSSRGGGGPYGYPQYGVGNAGNTWYACTMVDAKGKEIPWVDRDGKILKTIEERYRPAPGQKFFLYMGGQNSYKYRSPRLLSLRGNCVELPDSKDRIQYTLPVYADLPSLPELERKALWGLMIAQEARTLIPIYHTYNQAGFDPDKDMLQAYDGDWAGIGNPKWRSSTTVGLNVDWDLKSSLDGLYVAGGQILAAGDHAYAATTGRYAGRKAAAYAMGADEQPIDLKQVDADKLRVYAPLRRKNGMDWKELNAGVCRILQDYCGELKNEELLMIGRKWLDELEAGEAAAASARNPHELLHLLEVYNIMTLDRVIFEACLARKACNSHLGFTRTDYPELDPPEWNKWLTVKLDNGNVKVGELPLDYFGDLKENYQEHCGL